MCDYEQFIYTCGHTPTRKYSHCHAARCNDYHMCRSVKVLKRVWHQAFDCPDCMQGNQSGVNGSRKGYWFWEPSSVRDVLSLQKCFARFQRCLQWNVVDRFRWVDSQENRTSCQRGKEWKSEPFCLLERLNVFCWSWRSLYRRTNW